jgi:hypothetical protein
MSSNTENVLDNGSAPPLPIGGHSNSATAGILEILPQWVPYHLHLDRFDL